MEILQRHFNIALETPDGITKLRELILALAMQGKLVPQNPNDQSATQLFEQIQSEKKRRSVNNKQGQAPPLAINEDEIPYSLPKNWIWCRLDSISEYIQRGKGPKYSEVQEIPVISQKCIQWSGFDKDVVKFIEPDSISSYQKERFIIPGDLLWNSTGTGTIGRINIYNNELRSYARVVADSHVTVIRTLMVNGEFVLKFLMSPIVQRDLEAKASGTTNQIELNTSTVKNQLFPLPPLDEQIRIVKKIEELNELCDKLEKQRAKADSMLSLVNSSAIDRLLTSNNTSFIENFGFIKNEFNSIFASKTSVLNLKGAILQLAIMGKLSSTTSQPTNTKDLLKAIEIEKQNFNKTRVAKNETVQNPIKDEEKPFEIPSNWEWARLRNVTLRVHYGYTASANHNLTGVRMLRITDIQDNKVDWSTVPGCQITDKETEQFKLAENDILIARTGGTVGKSFLVRNVEVTAVFASYLIRLIPSTKIEVKYLKYFIESPFYWKQLYAKCSGTGQPNVNGVALSSLLIPLPPFAEQVMIANQVDRLLELCDVLDRRIEESTEKKIEILDAVISTL